MFARINLVRLHFKCLKGLAFKTKVTSNESKVDYNYQPNNFNSENDRNSKPSASATLKLHNPIVLGFGKIRILRYILK